MDVAIFTSADWSGEAAESDEIRPQWFPVTALPLDRMWDDGKLWLPRVLACERLRAVFSYAPDSETVAVVHHHSAAVATVPLQPVGGDPLGQPLDERARLRDRPAEVGFQVGERVARGDPGGAQLISAQRAAPGDGDHRDSRGARRGGAGHPDGCLAVQRLRVE